MVYMLLGTGFEETEAIAPLDLLRRAGVEVLTVGIDGKTVIGSHKIPVVADITIGDLQRATRVSLFNAMIDFGEREIAVNDINTELI